MKPSEPPLTLDHIQTLLTQVKSVGEGGLEPADLAQYQRLMEIYCLVKLGGRAVQAATAQHFFDRKRAELEAEIALLSQQDSGNAQIPLLHQEIRELQQAVSWRQQCWETVAEEEEAAVRAAMGIIDQALVSRGKHPPIHSDRP